MGFHRLAGDNDRAAFLVPINSYHYWTCFTLFYRAADRQENPPEASLFLENISSLVKVPTFEQ